MIVRARIEYPLPEPVTEGRLIDEWTSGYDDRDERIDFARRSEMALRNHHHARVDP